MLLFVFLNNFALSQTSDNVTTYPKDFETSNFEDEIFDPLEPLKMPLIPRPIHSESFQNGLMTI